MQQAELRRSARRKIDPLPVAIVLLRGGQRIEKLHFGEILEVSTTGAMIRVMGALLFDAGERIELLCFPENGAGDIPDPSTPSHMAGGIVWKNDAAGHIGVEFRP